MVMRSAPEMASFLIYCEQNPELRFWQALLAWSGEHYDLCEFAGDEVDLAVIRVGPLDTYYWEWEGEHPIGPKRRV